MCKLSICIPTYNRAEFLKECLQSLLPQITNGSVEVVVVDNASSDHTESVVRHFLNKCSYFRYFRNAKNLGYTGNQMKCFEYAKGDYIATLMDDDIYMEGEVKRILKVITEREYAFIALNYYAFIKNKFKPYRQNFAPGKDRFFNRAYDLWNYPGVGHYSGYVFNAKISKQVLQKLLLEKSISYYEKRRGIIGFLALRSMLSSNLPGYFIGYRGLANRMPTSVDYDSLIHLCIDYYAPYYDLYLKGLITSDDLERRTADVLRRLPKALLRNGGFLDSESLSTLKKQLSGWFHGKVKFDRYCLPIIGLLHNPLLRSLLRIVVKIYIVFKKVYWKIKA